MIATFRLDDGYRRWPELLDLILDAFSFMNGRIDPPSSALKLTPALLAEKARAEIGYLIEEEGRPIACLFCRPEKDCLYIGKFAVLPARQGKGLGRTLLALAEETAKGLSLQALRLETRIELAENHAAFGAWGFGRTAERCHPGFSRVTFVEMRKVL